MANTGKHLLVGSIEAYSGKSTAILGITHLLKKQGFTIGYGKPLGKCIDEELGVIGCKDVHFFLNAFEWSSEKTRYPLLQLDNQTISKRLTREDLTDYTQALQNYVAETSGDLVLLEGPENLTEGSLFNLSVKQIAEVIDAPILLVARYHSLLLIDSLISAKEFLGDRLQGIIINDVPRENLSAIQKEVVPFLETESIPVMGILPRENILHSVSVREISQRLGAEVLCRNDRLDLMVESIKIGAMNVNSALRFFREGKNMAVITGGDRTDLQLAALETSTQCLILTGQVPPQNLILSRAEDLEVPILSVDLDTLTTVEIVDNAFGRVSIQEPVKVECIQYLMEKHFDLAKFKHNFGLE